MRRIVVTSAAMLAVGVITACSGGQTSSDPSPATTGGEAQKSEAAANGPAAGGSAAGGSTDGNGTGHVGAVSTSLVTAAKIRTADLTVGVKDGQTVSRQADAAEAIATRAGGEVDGDQRTSGKFASATLQLRVPPAELSSSLTALSKLGTATSRHLTTRDVTEQVADVRSRTTSAQQAIARLRVLYSNATKVSDVISVENELSQRESDLESLEAQERSLAGRTELASVTVYLQVADTPVTKHRTDRSGFLGGLRDGWDAFTSGADHVAQAAGAVLPFAVVLLLLGFGARMLWPRLRTRRSAPTD